MKVAGCGQNNHINFHAGLTPAIREDISKIKVADIERQFKKLNIDCNLQNNKALAAMITFSANILEEAAEKFHLPFKFLPPSIRVFNPEELIEPVEEKCTGFCLDQTASVIKNEPPYLSTSIFLRNNPDNIDFYDTISENSYKLGRSASNHFLSKVLHELFHSIHLNHIYEKYGYNGDCLLTREIYNNGKNNPCGIDRIKELNELPPAEDIPIIMRFLGQYAMTSKMELFPEALTKLTAECIDENTMTLKRNPLNLLKNYPRCISTFVKGELEK